MPPLPQLRDYSEFRGELRGEILYRKLGWTEESVSAIGFGGSHFSEPGIDQATSVVITGVANRRDLDQAFEATRTFQPMNKEQVAELLARSRPYALEGKYELFKTGAVLDGTAKTTE